MKKAKLLSSELKMLNIGLDIFLDGLRAQNIKVIPINWNPSPQNRRQPGRESEDTLSKIL